MKTDAVVLGVGNRLRGDDGVGSLLIDELGEIPGLTAIDAGTTPENQIEPVVRLEPKRLLFVDACAFGGRPGEFRLFGSDEIERIAGGLVSTHTLPLSMTAALVAKQIEAEISLLGVQPERIEFGEGLSEPVRRALPELAGFVRQWARSGV